MTASERFAKQFEADRPKVLDEKTRKKLKELSRDKTKAQQFLQKTGIYDKNGQLTAEYR